jgi:hypothetical protein
MVGLSSFCKKALGRGPLDRAGSHIQHPIETKETLRRNMPSARAKAFSLTFVAAWTKVRHLAGRDPPVLLLVLKKDKEQQINDLLL